MPSSGSAFAPQLPGAPLAPRLKSKLTAIGQRYGAKAETPLGGYVVLASIYTTGLAVVLAVSRKRRRNPFPPRGVGGLLLHSLAVYRIARLVTRDKVTAPARAAFTEFQKPGRAGELEEKAKGEGLGRAVGQLLTCPYCAGPWVSLHLAGLRLASPASAEAIERLFAGIALADTFQELRAYLNKLS